MPMSLPAVGGLPPVAWVAVVAALLALWLGVRLGRASERRRAEGATPAHRAPAAANLPALSSIATDDADPAEQANATRWARYERRIAGEVLRSMSEAVAVLDVHGRFIAVNPAFTRITGFSEDEVLGKPMRMLDSQRHDDAWQQHRRDELLRDGQWRGDVWKLRKDGTEILCHVRNNLVDDDSGERRLTVVVISDITEQKRAEQELRYLANYDTLTGLPNRSLLSERLGRAMVRARREAGRVAVLFLDLDRFKDVNDTMGHATGDRVLRAAAIRVQQAVGPQHTVARLGGDEFTVVLEDLESTAAAETVARHVIAAFNQPLVFGEGREIIVSPSIGISVFPDHAQVPSELLKNADTAMYQAKAAGRRTCEVYSASMDERTKRRALLVGALRDVLERDELRLAYQPRYSLGDRRIVGVEALMRWDSAQFGSVSPAEFIPLAEESGMILEIGAWALREACATLQDWRAGGLDGVAMSVNLSALQLLRGDLPSMVAHTLRESNLPPELLELELTESVVMASPEENITVLRACRDLGVALAIDDFGTGYSSLAYLKRLPINTLKIDQEFVGDLTRDDDDEAITAAIIAMGHSLGLKVVAEGVETVGQLGFLLEHGCDEVQGHLVSAALDRDACRDFLHVPPTWLRAGGLRAS